MEILWFFIISFIAISVLAIGIFMHFAQSDNHPFIVLLSILGFGVGFSMIAILPSDIYLSRHNAESKIEYKDFYEYFLPLIWKTFYWTSYIIGWCLGPMTRNYINSAKFSVFDKLCDCIQRNVITFAIGMFGFLANFLYLCFAKKLEEFTRKGIYGFLIGIGNTLGILFLLFFLGAGLVALPRYFFFRISYKARFCQLLQNIGFSKKKLSQQKKHINLLMNQLCSFNASPEDEQFRDHIVSKVLKIERIIGEIQKNEIIPFDAPDINKARLVKINKEINSIYHKTNVYSEKIKRNIKEAQNLFYVFIDQTTKIKKFYYLFFKPFMMTFLFILTSLFSIVVAGKELIYFLEEVNFIDWIEEIGIPQLEIFILTVPLIILMLACFHGIFTLRIGTFIGLYVRKTLPASLLFTAYYMAKLGPPLCYNFLKGILSNKYDETETQFQKCITDKSADLVSIFSINVQNYLSTILIFFCFCNLCQFHKLFYRCFKNHPLFKKYIGIYLPIQDTKVKHQLDGISILKQILYKNDPQSHHQIKQFFLKMKVNSKKGIPQKKDSDKSLL